MVRSDVCSAMLSGVSPSRAVVHNDFSCTVPAPRATADWVQARRLGHADDICWPYACVVSAWSHKSMTCMASSKL